MIGGDLVGEDGHFWPLQSDFGTIVDDSAIDISDDAGRINNREAGGIDG